MFCPDSFKISTPSDHEIQVTRDFDAPRQLVFDAFTKPDLVKRCCSVRRVGPCRFAKSIFRLAARIDMCGASPASRIWGWAACFEKS